MRMPLLSTGPVEGALGLVHRLDHNEVRKLRAVRAIAVRIVMLRANVCAAKSRA
jgi:hypothetical protein